MHDHPEAVIRPVDERPNRSFSPTIEQLNSLDEVFLAVENPTNPMNIGSVGFFEGPMPPRRVLLELVAHTIRLEPRCRQTVRAPLGALGRPMWIDDESFDPALHVEFTSLPQPSAESLTDIVAHFVAEPLDRRRSLWRILFIDGCDDGRWAMVVKVHHCMVDGISGSDLLGAMLTPSPEVPSIVTEPQVASPTPSRRDVTAYVFRTTLGSLAARFRGVCRTLCHPRQTWRRAIDIVTAARELWFRQPHPPTALLGPIGTQRRWAHCRVPLDHVHAIRTRGGTTVNDVVVAAVAVGLRNFLVQRGESIEGRSITAMIPVSLRDTSERDAVGNRVANVHARIPVDFEDLRSLVLQVHEHLDDLKTSHQVDATGLVMHMGTFLPRFVADRIARTIFRHQRTVETVITNVPGPRRPLFLGTHRMVEAYPVAPIGGLVRITIAVWSYCDDLTFGITCDRDAITDVDLRILVEGLETGFASMDRLDDSRECRVEGE